MINKVTQKQIAQADFSTELDRFEAKYIIPRVLVAPMKDFMRPYVEMDKHCTTDGGSYYINTLQLDNDDLSLHYAKEREAMYRFKLRVRTYGERVGKAPVFLEIKRKYFDRVIKSRAMIPFEAWAPGVLKKTPEALGIKTVKEREAFREFVRLRNEIDAKGLVYVRYNREAYAGIYEHYSRVTFDSQLCYQPARNMYDWGMNGRYLSMDSGLVRSRPDSTLVLEIKCTEQVPTWLIDMVQEFDLIRCGNCKYSTAIWMENLMMGNRDAPFADAILND